MSAVLGIAGLLLAAFFGLALYWHRRWPELRWDWASIDPSAVRFPAGFVWGVATAAHQVEGGCDDNNWSRWEASPDAQGRPRIKDGQKAGAACEHWTRFKDDVGLMRELGVGAYRFSMEWSKIEPRRGEISDEALQHYHEVCDALLEAGIEPVVTVHHFTHPLWFDELGAFERQQNVAYLVEFGVRLFREFGGKVRTWCTINEPEVVALMGYAVGVFPPGKQDVQAASTVLGNLLLAHTELYHAMKRLPGGERARIGLAKNITQFDPWHRWNPLDWLLSRAMNRLFNEAILDYLRTGRFRVVLPGLARVDWTHPGGGRNCLDFFGLNYYSHIHVQFRGRPASAQQVLRYRADDVMTDMPYAIYAEGFYRALLDARKLGVPILVTENGIADARDDRRELFLERYLYALGRAMQDGCDVRGYFYWSLMDNFEWAEGYDMRFGLYEVDFATQQRRLRPGAQPFVAAVRKTRRKEQA